MKEAKNPMNPVLVVGGGPVGLSTALFLAAREVPVVLVEKHLTSNPHPRAVGWTARTMELLAPVGVTEQVQRADVGGSKPRRVRVETLAGAWLEEQAWTPGGGAPSVRFSPYTNARMAQDELEPLLRERAVALGADVRMGTKLEHFEQDEHGLTGYLRGPDGEVTPLRASYLVAADGSRSPVREALGIGRSGHGAAKTVRSVLFRAQLPAQLSARVEEARVQGIVQFAIEQPDVRALLGQYPDGRYLLMFYDDVERDEATLQAAIRRAIGVPDLTPEIVVTGRWEVSGRIADRFSVGRVFLAGDAAHTLPPNRGGFGANTGIDDAHNLAWKLHAVLSGNSDPALLDTYDAERRPIAWLRHDQIFARPDHAYAGAAGKSEIFDDDAMELGQLYRSSIVVSADESLPPARRPDQWGGQPGTRAPHFWVTPRSGGTVSSLSLYQRDWLLLSDDASWCSAGNDLGIESIQFGVEMNVCTEGDFHRAFGLKEGGAVLVRPDGYIAWRSPARTADDAASLRAAFTQASARSERQPGGG